MSLYSKLAGLIARVQKDKLIHLVLSCLATLVFGGIFANLGFEHDSTVYLSLACAFGLGIIKEVVDFFVPEGTFDWNDLGADFLGVCIGLLFVALFIA